MPSTQPAPAPPTAKTSRRRKAKPSCGDCYFGRRMLCALQIEGPCSTFRPDSPEGLVPPTQPALLIRSGSEPEAESDPSVEVAAAA